MSALEKFPGPWGQIWRQMDGEINLDRGMFVCFALYIFFATHYLPLSH